MFFLFCRDFPDIPCARSPVYISGMKDDNPGSSDGLCFACGRFSGRADECHYCNAEMPSGSLRTICRRWGLLAILAGLAILWFWSGSQPVRRVSISEISPQMNYALVSIAGEVASKPYIKLDGNDAYASFLLSDGAGVVRVCIAGSLAKDFAEDPEISRKGASLGITGVLSVKKAREVKLYVRKVKGATPWMLVRAT